MREAIYDNNSRLIGYVKDSGDKQEVLDKNSRLLGYVKHDGTYDKNNHRVSKGQLPGLLFGCY